MSLKQFWLLAALGLALVLGQVVATTVSGAVVVPEEVAEHNLVVVSTDVEGPRYVWWIVGPRGLEEFKSSNANNSEVVFTGPPGEYQILLAVIPEQGEPAKSNAVMSIVKGNAPPDPDPDPDPDPEPEPDPDPTPNQKWQVVIIYEANDLDNYPAGQVAIIKSLALRKQLAEAGHTLLPGGIMDLNSVNRNNKVPVVLQPFYNVCKGDKFPRICISPMDGGTVQDFDLPADGDAVLTLLKGAVQ